MATSVAREIHFGPGAPPTGRIPLGLAAGLLALAIFVVDTLTPLEGAVAVLYVVVVLLAAKISRRDLMLASAASVVLTAAAYLMSHGWHHVGSPTIRAAVSLAATGIVTFLSLQNQQASEKLLAQAQLLDLSHDMIFVRDPAGPITFWSRGAEECYGWTGSEAIGRRADDLLRTRYPSDRTGIEAELLCRGWWVGVVRQRTKSGFEIVVESRWAIQRDERGRPSGVLETHRDVTEREASHAALTQSERRYRRMFDASRAGLQQQDWSQVRSELRKLERSGVQDLASHLAHGTEFLERAKALVRIVDVNPAMLAITGAGSVPTFLGSLKDILSETDQTFAESVLAFARGDRFFEGETEVRTVDGRRVPVLFGLTFPGEEEGSDGEVLVFVVDVTERDKAQNALLAAQADLARAARVATLGELTASIAHEVNQPLAAIVTSGEAALRWLRRDVPDLGEVSSALTRTIDEGKRASAIVTRIRTFLAKGQLSRDRLNPAEVIEDAVLLVEHELAKNGVTVHMQIDADLPEVLADRVQFQQVLVNLMVNGAQAMASIPGSRRLTLRAKREAADQVAFAVRDSGHGIADDRLARLFEPFFTTKNEGMGMGLAICRSTVEAHGGRLTVQSRPGEGATFAFTLPVAEGVSP
ncbi:PAS domain-containing sensor histidine kinase [Methylobacterium soli]|uniref:C4-dicarboxylate transport sensor protein DctB n=1 Tax=Methylobacterium soli TaxID=553447 RepID=A0A6L3T2A4_9HYPH|nr:PAS domain-containing sensor histidine kinase [Methylobacterium soli]KAB1080862.1 PAS domain S-box protein [Methylobacterium soli]GJE41643.1 Adaptive-response sensory-kinase SasA [Methylobacterium soli]